MGGVRAVATVVRIEDELRCLVARRRRAATGTGPTTCVPQKSASPQSRLPGLQKGEKPKQEEQSAKIGAFIAKKGLTHTGGGGALVMQHGGGCREGTESVQRNVSTSKPFFFFLFFF